MSIRNIPYLLLQFTRCPAPASTKPPDMSAHIPRWIFTGASPFDRRTKVV